MSLTNAAETALLTLLFNNTDWRVGNGNFQRVWRDDWNAAPRFEASATKAARPL